jgi:hypothetical protein
LILRDPKRMGLLKRCDERARPCRSSGPSVGHQPRVVPGMSFSKKALTFGIGTRFAPAVVNSILVI